MRLLVLASYNCKQVLSIADDTRNGKHRTREGAGSLAPVTVDMVLHPPRSEPRKLSGAFVRLRNLVPLPWRSSWTLDLTLRCFSIFSRGRELLEELVNKFRCHVSTRHLVLA